MESGRHREGVLVALDAGGGVLTVYQHAAQGLVSFGELPSHRKGFQKAALRLLQLSAPLEDDAQIVHHLGILRQEIASALVVFPSFIAAIEQQQRVSEI